MSRSQRCDYSEAVEVAGLRTPRLVTSFMACEAVVVATGVAVEHGSSSLTSGLSHEGGVNFYFM